MASDRTAPPTPARHHAPPWAILATAFGAAAAFLWHAAPVFERYNVEAIDLFPEMRRLYLAQKKATQFRFPFAQPEINARPRSGDPR